MSDLNLAFSEFLSQVPWVVHAFGVGPCDVSDIAEGDIRYFDTKQVHGKRVACLDDQKEGSVLTADAFMASEPGLVCYVRTADCVPILIADRGNRAVAAVHAGWKGTALDIAGETVREMERAYGTDPADCVAAIGPGICGSCYEVGFDVIDGLESLDIAPDWRVDDRHVDLGLANVSLLARAGVREIDFIRVCTACDGRFASWRRDRTPSRQVNIILINK